MFFFMFSMFHNLEVIRFLQYYDADSLIYECSSVHYDTVDVTFTFPPIMRTLHITYISAEWHISSLTVKGAPNLTVINLAHVAFFAFDLKFYG